jgi:hypothetical protein
MTTPRAGGAASVALSPVPRAGDCAPFNEERWDAWVTKGRLADAAFAEKARTMTMLGVAVAIGVATVWMMAG